MFWSFPKKLLLSKAVLYGDSVAQDSRNIVKNLENIDELIFCYGNHQQHCFNVIEIG